MGRASAIAGLLLLAHSLMIAYAHEQSPAQRAKEIFENRKQAVVKLRVNGIDPSDKTRKIEGTGFFVFSDQRISLLLTAQHVVGSSETEQTKNNDWKVENGTVSRKIELDSLDDRGALISRGNEVQVAPTGLTGVDIAILVINQGGYPVIPIADAFSEKADPHDVMLLAFRKGKNELTRPLPIGIGQLDGFKYVTSIGAREGESGGPWIDIQSGSVFAVASLNRNDSTGPSTDATPVNLIRSALSMYQGATPSLPAPLHQQSFKVLAVRGDAFVSIRGDTGGLRVGSDQHREIGQLADIRGRGDETSECDPGSGRSLSQAAARGQIARSSGNGLRFEYAVEAQGGHYQTAATCLAGVPVGLTGHDTSAFSEVKFQGTMGFAVNGDNIALEWRGMPSTGAAYRLMRDQQIIRSGELADTGRVDFQSLEPGQYELLPTLQTAVQSRGACCPQNSAGNGTITIVPLPLSQ